MLAILAGPVATLREIPNQRAITSALRELLREELGLTPSPAFAELESQILNDDPTLLGAGTPPETLECTGLYFNLERKVLAQGVRAYAPAIALWADTAEKSRWMAW